MNISKLDTMETLNKSTYTRVLTCIFDSVADAETACTELVNRGYAPDEITVIMSDATRDRYFEQREHDIQPAINSPEETGVETAIEVLVGVVAAFGSLVAVPGIGLIVGGPPITSLTEENRNKHYTGITETLIQAGIPEEEAVYYEDSLKAGGIVIGVAPRDDEDRKAILDEWNYYRAKQIHGSEAYTI
jgi:hypothetical protein